MRYFGLYKIVLTEFHEDTSYASGTIVVDKVSQGNNSEIVEGWRFMPLKAKKDENNMTKNIIISILFSATLLIGIMACLICNIAISGNLTWSLIPISSTVFAWIIVSVSKGIERKLVALGTIFLLAIPFMIIVNVILSKMIAEPVLDVWDMLSISMLLILAFVSFICDYAKKKGLMKQ